MSTSRTREKADKLTYTQAEVTAKDTAARAGRKNLIINGGFDVWQRGTSQTASGFGSDDRWNNLAATSTQTVSRQAFTLGQTDVPNNPKYYSRTVVSSVAGAANLIIKLYKIENVETLAGTTATLSFWAKADANKNIAIEFEQAFGTGGSPSTTVRFGTTTLSLTTSWAKQTISVALPSITGKTLGTANDHISIVIWLDAGSDYNSRTNSLGQQSGTFEFSNVQLEKGSVATDFEHRSYGEILADCQRYYWSTEARFYIKQYTSTHRMAQVRLPVTMRGTPTATYGVSAGTGWTPFDFTIDQITFYKASGYSDTATYSFNNLKVDAEL